MGVHPPNSHDTTLPSPPSLPPLTGVRGVAKGYNKKEKEKKEKFVELKMLIGKL